MHAAGQLAAKYDAARRCRCVGRRVDLVERGLVLGRAHAGVDLVLEHEREMLLHECSLLGGEFLWLGYFQKTLQPKTKIAAGHRPRTHASFVPTADKNVTRLDTLRAAEAARREMESAFLDVMRAYDGAAELAEAQELSRRRADEIWALYERLTEGRW